MDTTAGQMRLIQAQIADVKRLLVDEELAVEREIRALEKDRTDLVCCTPHVGMLSVDMLMRCGFTAGVGDGHHSQLHCTDVCTQPASSHDQS